MYNYLSGQIAQLVEQRIENPRVGGSIPPLATNFVAFALRKHKRDPAVLVAAAIFQRKIARAPPSMKPSQRYYSRAEKS